MKNIYRQSESEKAVGRLLRISAVIIMVMVWILIDKGNIYGQSLSQKDAVSKQLTGQSVQSPQFREGDGDDSGRDGDIIPTDDDDSGEFVVKPNPVHTDLVFDFEFTVRTGIPYQVVDPLGRLVARGVFEPGVSTQSLDFSRFKSGLYIVTLDLGDKVAVRRIVKQ